MVVFVVSEGGGVTAVVGGVVFSSLPGATTVFSMTCSWITTFSMTRALTNE